VHGPGLGVGQSERIHTDGSPARRAHQRRAVEVAVQAHERVKPSCEARDRRARQVLGDRACERVAAGAVAAPGLAQVPVVLAALQQMRERELVDRRAAVICHGALG